MCPVNDRVKIQIFLCHVSSSAPQRILLLSYAAGSRAVQPAYSFRSFSAQQRLLLLSYAVCSRAVQQPSSFHSRCAFSFVSFYPVRHTAVRFRFVPSLPAGFVYAGICAFSFSPASISFNFAYTASASAACPFLIHVLSVFLTWLCICGCRQKRNARSCAIRR